VLAIICSQADAVARCELAREKDIAVSKLLLFVRCIFGEREELLNFLARDLALDPLQLASHGETKSLRDLYSCRNMRMVKVSSPLLVSLPLRDSAVQVAAETISNPTI
jgi:hypothetical protein